MTKKSDRRHIIPRVSGAGEKPLYLQISEAVKKEIREGRIQPGQPLPSFRALAEDLMVSLITVKRAYEGLEEQGIIERRHGLGTFVSEFGDVRTQESQHNQAEKRLREVVQESLDAGFSEDQILNQVKKLIQEAGRSRQ